MNGIGNKARKANLLTAAEEIDLARRVQEGIRAVEALESHAREGGLDDARVRELEDAVRSGKDAKSRFVESNMGLVRFVANKFKDRGLDYDDLVQEGVFGLMRASEKFDPDMGNRFSTYATWWIRQAMGKAVNSQSRTIRIPEGASEKLGKIARKESELRQELGYEPSDWEVEEALGMPDGKVSEVKRLAMTPISLDSKIKSGGKEGRKRPLAEMVGDGRQLEPSASLEASGESDVVRASLECLTGHERAVVELRYGLDGAEPRSLKEVADELGVTEERARQAEFKALARMRFAIERARRQAEV